VLERSISRAKARSGRPSFFTTSNAFDAIPLMRQDPSLRETLIVTTTDNDTPGCWQEARDCGFDEFPVKPADLGRVAHAHSETAT